MKHTNSLVFALIAFVFCLLLSGCTQQMEEKHVSPDREQENQVSQQISFLFFSDAQADVDTGDYHGWGSLLSYARAQTANPDLVVFGGDMVNDGGDDTEWNDFWEAAAIPLAGLTTAAVPGNHDNHPLLAEQFDYPKQAPSGQGEGYFYSVDIGNIHIIMLDSNIMGAAKQEDINWLENDLKIAAAQQVDWRIAVMHHPMWPLTENPKDLARAETMREYFLPLLDSYNVDLILCGHQHVYARSLAMNVEGTAESNGIIQIMAASGGKKSYVIENRDYIAANAAAPNYLLVTANNKGLTVTAYDENNKQIDNFTIMR